MMQSASAKTLVGHAGVLVSQRKNKNAASRSEVAFCVRSGARGFVLSEQHASLSAMRLFAAVVVATVAAGLVARWIRAGSAMSAQDWARDPIGPDDLAG
jgi:hypothetical protein